MRKRVLFALVAVLLALTATIGNAAPPPNGPPGIDQAIAAQEAHNPRLLGKPGVVGTAVGLTPDGRAAVKIFTETAGIAGLPDVLDGVPVAIEVTGKLVAMAGPPAEVAAKGNKPSGTSTTSWWSRPVPIGVSTGNANECAAGTIGARVVQGTRVFALSNNHVYARENKASIGETIAQPGLYDTGCSYKDQDYLGRLEDFQTLDFSGQPNYIDAAIASTTVYTLSNTTPGNGYGMPASSKVDPAIGLNVQKYGRTTGLTMGTITGINASVMVGYSTGTALFEKQIVVQSGKPFIKAGDSGSLLVTANSASNPVGLLFAGSSNGRLAIANDIGLVLSRFNVSIDGR